MAGKSGKGASPIIIKRIEGGGEAGHHGGAWKVAYADFVTAMMAFFMLLWLLSNPDKVKLKGLAEYFSPSSASAKPGEQADSLSDITSLGSKAGAGSSQAAERAASSNAGGEARIPDPTLRIVAEELKLLLQPTTVPRAERQAIQMQQVREGLRVSLMDDASRSMFRPGTAVLNGYARTLLRQVAGKVARTGLQIAIEGHTGGVGGLNDANWRLSADRALAARDALITGGLSPDRFSEVVALAATQPVYPDQPARAENRRITIVLLAEASPLPSDLQATFQP